MRPTSLFPWPVVLFLCSAALLLAVWLSHAKGAEADLCRPYATQLTEKIIKQAWQAAYSDCVNSDVVPEVPLTSADAWKAIERRYVAHFQDIDLDKVGVVPAAGPEPIKAPEPVINDDNGKGNGRSGFARGSAGWNAYCKRYWPASFDAKSGTVIKVGHRRIPCPA